MAILEEWKTRLQTVSPGTFTSGSDLDCYREKRNGRKQNHGLGL